MFKLELPRPSGRGQEIKGPALAKNLNAIYYIEVLIHSFIWSKPQIFN